MSSGSESDEEYVPEEPEKVSEEESADEETDLQYEKEQANHQGQKRKLSENIRGKKKVKANDNKEKVEEELQTKEVSKKEDEKKREDDLWAKFLEGTDTKPKTSASNTTTHSKTSVKTVTTSSKAKGDDNLERERRIFEFAGETIVVEDNVIKEKLKSAEKPSPGTGDVGHSRGCGSGLSNVLGQLNKKNKLSTLEKSKLDWATYKKEEGIEDDIHSHNKGKSGYLDRQDFLERADLRQYEIERDLKMKRRSNR